MVSSGVNAGTTYYLNDAASGAMEEREVVAGVTTWRDYIMADGKLIAQRQCVGPPPCSSGAAMLYFILDHLESVTVVTDGSGAVLQRLSYDAWGKRRNADGSALSCTGGLSLPNGVSRGFTGQEMIDALCLVNLNARVYDPTLGRFMSADPVVGDATIPQELNRFSYVLNDPLSLTDPSGLCFLGCFWKSAIFRDVLAIAVAIVLEDPDAIWALQTGLGEIGVGLTWTQASFVEIAVAGGVSGLISSGGSLKGAALGALEADLFFEAGNLLQDAPKGGYLGVGSRADAFVGHGLVGGLTSELRGGNFGSGFLAGGIGSIVPVHMGIQDAEQTIEGTVESAALGGVGSVLGGGKFQDGAVTGAFGYLFNECMHNKCWVGAKDLATYQKGGVYGLYSSMCDGGKGEPFACAAKNIAWNAPINPQGAEAAQWLTDAYQQAHATRWDYADGIAVPIDGQMTDAQVRAYSIGLADRYIDLFGVTQDQAKITSWIAIDQIHWDENAVFGLGPNAYAATPFGRLAPWITKDVICPRCSH